MTTTTPLSDRWSLALHPGLALALCSIACLSARPCVAQAQQDARPPAMREVDVTEHLGDTLPLTTPLRDTRGQSVTLGDYFEPDRPVLLTLAYVRCPMLCSLLLQGLASAVRQLDVRPGQDYRLVTIAIDPSETDAAAQARKRKLLAAIDSVSSAEEDWSYLRGEEAQVREIADALGFSYAWDARSETYAHAAVAFVVTGDGVISRYFHGVRFAPEQLDLALRTASEGSVGERVAEAVLTCFRFDPALRVHRERIQGFFKAGSTAVFGGLLSLVAGLYIWERRRR